MYPAEKLTHHVQTPLIPHWSVTSRGTTSHQIWKNEKERKAEKKKKIRVGWSNSDQGIERRRMNKKKKQVQIKTHTDLNSTIFFFVFNYVF